MNRLETGEATPANAGQQRRLCQGRARRTGLARNLSLALGGAAVLVLSTAWPHTVTQRLRATPALILGTVPVGRMGGGSTPILAVDGRAGRQRRGGPGQ